jgi:Tfp pilus assembly PilM family ATPase
MPSTQAVWGIEIGQCALKAIRLRHDPQDNKVEALAFDYIEHSKILSQPDADPDALSREAIQTFLSRNTVKGDRVVIGVPGQSGLARFIKLPPVEPSRIPEIVKYEARQQIPFALDEVVWDFQTIGQAEEAGGFALETEIGLFAMKRDLIYRFMNPFRETSVEVDVVQMRPLAVYNFAAIRFHPRRVPRAKRKPTRTRAKVSAKNSSKATSRLNMLKAGSPSCSTWEPTTATWSSPTGRASGSEISLSAAIISHEL